MAVSLAVEPVSMALREPFRIARETFTRTEVVHLRLESGGTTGWGEGAPVDFWGEDARGVAAALEADAGTLIGEDPFALEAVAARLAAWDGPQGAKMAIDGALHDWIGHAVGQPWWRLLGVGPVSPPTSYTIGIDSVEGTADRVRRAASDFAVLKVKVGGPGDLERLEAVRAGFPGRIRIDGNEGWDLATAEALTPRLRELGVEFIEQPFPAADSDAFRAYRARPDRLPVLVDEGCRDLASVAPVAAHADGIVIKLAKAGGLREALRMIHAARALGLSVMLGCMVESQLGIAHAAALAPLVDFVDLDGHLLVADAPFTGLALRDGRIVLPDSPGLGVAPA